MNTQECRAKPKIININNNEPVFYLYSVNINNNEPVFYLYSVNIDKSSGSCNNINDPYAKLCIHDAIKLNASI